MITTNNIPGFTAEASLYGMYAPYRAGGAVKADKGIFRSILIAASASTLVKTSATGLTRITPDAPSAAS